MTGCLKRWKTAILPENRQPERFSVKQNLSAFLQDKALFACVHTFNPVLADGGARPTIAFDGLPDFQQTAVFVCVGVAGAVNLGFTGFCDAEALSPVQMTAFIAFVFMFDKLPFNVAADKRWIFIGLPHAEAADGMVLAVKKLMFAVGLGEAG